LSAAPTPKKISSPWHVRLRNSSLSSLNKYSPTSKCFPTTPRVPSCIASRNPHVTDACAVSCLRLANATDEDGMIEVSATLESDTSPRYDGSGLNESKEERCLFPGLVVSHIFKTIKKMLDEDLVAAAAQHFEKPRLSVHDLCLYVWLLCPSSHCHKYPLSSKMMARSLSCVLLFRSSNSSTIEELCPTRLSQPKNPTDEDDVFWNESLWIYNHFRKRLMRSKYCGSSIMFPATGSHLIEKHSTLSTRTWHLRNHNEDQPMSGEKSQKHRQDEDMVCSSRKCSASGTYLSQ
jgi:hypothetical protein